MSDAGRELAALVSKVKVHVAELRSKKPQGKVLTSLPMTSSARVKEAEMLKSLSRVPVFSPAAAPQPQGSAKVVFASAQPIIGESPAGKLLAKIVQAMGLSGQHAAFCTLAELPLLLERAKPRAVVALGEEATRTLLGAAEPWDKLRGRFAQYQGLPLMPTHHPSELLEQDALKRHVWEDMKLVAQRLKA